MTHDAARGLAIETAQAPRSLDTGEVLLDLVEATPGLSLSELRNRAKLAWGTLYSHLELLEQRGLIQAEQDGRRRRLYPTGLRPEERLEGAAWAILGGPRNLSARRVAALIVREVGISRHALVKRLHMPPSSVYHTVRRLLQAGLVQKEGCWRIQLYPTPFLCDVLPRYYVNFQRN